MLADIKRVLALCNWEAPMRFIRKNGRVIPIKDGSAHGHSAPKRAGFLGRAKTGAMAGSMLGAIVGGYAPIIGAALTGKGFVAGSKILKSAAKGAAVTAGA